MLDRPYDSEASRHDGYNRLALMEEADDDPDATALDELTEEKTAGPSSVISSDGDDIVIVATPPAASQRTGFVAAWEGLRGVAVLMTCQSHNARTYWGQHEILGRGGVTVFLVLSGYLITGVLMHMQQKQQNSRPLSIYAHVPRFLLDRIVRLYPAVVLMLAITAVTFTYVKGAWPFQTTIPYQILRVLSYTSNFETRGIFWINCWTIALEQQFYIVWAFVLPILAARQTWMRATLMTIMIVVSYALLCCGVSGFNVVPSWLGGIYSPFSNFYKLSFGAMLQLVPVPQWVYSKRTGWYGSTILAGFLVLAFAGDFPSGPGYYFRHVLVLEPVLSFATALIVLGTERAGNGLLENSILRFIGRVSYAFYLYQSPMQQIAPVAALGYAGVALAALAFVLAMWSTLYVEEPLRERYRQWRQQRPLQ